MLNKLERKIRSEVIGKIKEIEREENFDMRDFAFQLWEEENVNGTCTFSTHKSINWIKRYFSEIGDYVETYQEEYGDSPGNPFLNPEAFQVVISIGVTINLLERIWKDGISKKELINGLRGMN